MRILSFEFRDADGWTLEPMKLEAFNLLVGVSGAGKTRIVRAIERVCEVALGTDDAELARGSSFAIDFEHEGLTYRWKAEMEPQRGWLDKATTPAHELPLVHTERIEQGGRLLVERTPERFMLQGLPIPRLSRAKGAIAVLKEDPAMSPLYVAFSHCISRTLDAMPGHSLNSSEHLDMQCQQYESVDVLGADFSLTIHHKAEILEHLFPEAFAAIEETFREAFPLVEELTVDRALSPDQDLDQPWTGGYAAYLAVKESGITRSIPFYSMSSGMQRYLTFLVHLSFAPRGTVVLIDELESSFGINCLPAATDFLLDRAPDLQLILTSHHPYIIEKIPVDYWKIVTRKGSQVRVLDASTIPALEESLSHLDRFTRLINLPEYRRGIQAA